MLCSNCSQNQPLTYPVSLNALKVLRLFQGSDYDTARRLKLDSELSRQLETVMRDYFKYLLEREVKSTAWLADLREQKFNQATLP